MPLLAHTDGWAPPPSAPYTSPPRAPSEPHTPYRISPFSYPFKTPQPPPPFCCHPPGCWPSDDLLSPLADAAARVDLPRVVWVGVVGGEGVAGDWCQIALFPLSGTHKWMGSSPQPPTHAHPAPSAHPPSRNSPTPSPTRHRSPLNRSAATHQCSSYRSSSSAGRSLYKAGATCTPHT